MLLFHSFKASGSTFKSFTRALDAVSSKAVFMLFLIYSLLLLPLFCVALVFNPCFVVHNSVQFLGFQSSHFEKRELVAFP